MHPLKFNSSTISFSFPSVPPVKMDMTAFCAAEPWILPRGERAMDPFQGLQITNNLALCLPASESQEHEDYCACYFHASTLSKDALKTAVGSSMGDCQVKLETQSVLSLTSCRWPQLI